MKKTCLFILFISVATYAPAQTSRINSDTIKDSKVRVQQMGSEDSQVSDISSRNMNGSEIDVIQTDTASKEPEQTGVMQYINNANAIIMLITSLIVLGGYLGLKKYFKKNTP